MCEFLTALIERIVFEGQIQPDLDGKSRNAELKTSPNIFRGNTPQGLRGMGHFSAFKVRVTLHRKVKMLCRRAPPLGWPVGSVERGLGLARILTAR